MVTPKLFIILCVIVPVLAQSNGTEPPAAPAATEPAKESTATAAVTLGIVQEAVIRKCLEDRTIWTDDPETKACELYRELRPCLENANVDEKDIVEGIQALRKKLPKLKEKCGCATIALNIAIGFSSMAAIVLQKMGMLRHF